jgi:hypothetical protein
MQLKKILTIMLLLFLATQNVVAANYQVTWHSIDLDIDKEGKGKIAERFYIFFPTTEDLNEFKQITNTFGVAIEDELKKLDPSIRTYIGKTKDIVPGSGSIGFIEGEDNFLEIRYDLETPLFEKTDETSRSTSFELQSHLFTPFLSKPFYVLPPQTVVTFLLPAQTAVNADDVLPEGDIYNRGKRTVVTWTGEKTTTNLELNYTYWKQIAPSLSLAGFVQDVLENTRRELLILLSVIFVLAVAFIYLRRKGLGDKISGYVVKHSEL